MSPFDVRLIIDILLNGSPLIFAIIAVCFAWRSSKHLVLFSTISFFMLFGMLDFILFSTRQIMVPELISPPAKTSHSELMKIYTHNQRVFELSEIALIISVVATGLAGMSILYKLHKALSAPDDKQDRSLPENR